MIKFLDLEKVTASFEPGLSQEVQRVVRSGWYLLGNEVHAFAARGGCSRFGAAPVHGVWLQHIRTAEGA